MKIVHITEAWKGGIETYVDGLIKYQHDSKQFSSINLICATKLTPIFKKSYPARQYFYNSSRNPLKFLRIASGIRKIIQEINPDIIHLHSTFPGVYARILSIKNSNGKRIPIVYCAHGWSFCQEGNFFIREIYALIERILSRRTDIIINISQYEHDMAMKAKVIAKHNPVILSCVRDIIQTQAMPIVKQNGILNIGFIGRLDWQKGFDFLSQQLSSSSQSNIKVFVIGESVIKKKGMLINEEFDYYGWVDNNQIDDYFKCFDIIVVPSRWEGFGLVVIEAFRNAKPVIVSNRGALPELVIEGYNGYIFDFDNPQSFLEIIKTLDGSELEIMGKNARLTYENSFSKNRHYIETTEIYRNLGK